MCYGIGEELVVLMDSVGLVAPATRRGKERCLPDTGARWPPRPTYTRSEEAGYSLTSTPTPGSRGDRNLPSGTM